MALSAVLPTLYEYYTAGGISSGLSADQPYFTLNDKNVSLYSGAMHYFRVPKQYWRDRLRKIRAAGLNTVETYIPWNLHEPESGKFDFGNGGSEMQDFLDVQEFLKIAQEEDLFAIIRSGPYICAEWEFGGLPSWLLKEEGVSVRTSDNVFMKYVKRYFNVLLPILAMLQFTKGGPIVAFQVENEYGIFWTDVDKVYLQELEKLMVDNGIVELLVSADNPLKHGVLGSLPEFLYTGNFGTNPEGNFVRMRELQENKPLMAMEYWSGWFDHWSENHHTLKNTEFEDIYERILTYPASVNLYMFHGGTSFGFLNGANLKSGLTNNSDYQPTISSYDYDAPLSEAGDYTEKYYIVKQLLEKYNTVKTKTPDLPEIITRIAYPSIEIEEQILLKNVIAVETDAIKNGYPLAMELLPINNNSGQSYGYLVYRKKNIDLPANSILQIEGHVCDTVMVLINGVLKSPALNHVSDLDGFGFWRSENSTLLLNDEEIKNATVDLVVENWGRVNVGQLKHFSQYKGIWQGNVSINGNIISNWSHIPLEFKKFWVNQLNQWEEVNEEEGPALYKGNLVIEDSPKDTFIDMQNWTKGIVMVNGFVIGRYAKIGPQQTLYLPAPFLNEGHNDIIVFEHFKPSDKIVFSTDIIFKTNQ